MTHKHNFPDSSSISCCEYDPATKDMHITFVSGGKHKFSGVDQEDFDGFKTADSVGKHYHSAIRRKYKGEKVEE
jgi:hypothetical protein